MDNYIAAMPKELRQQGRTATYPKGAPILHMGQENACVYFVLEGLALGTLTDEKGARVFVDEYGPGDLFGELEVLCPDVRTIGITAATACTVFALHRKHLAAWMQADFAFTWALTGHLAARMRRYANDASQLQLLTVRQRVEHAILTYHGMGLLPQLDKQTLAMRAKTPRRSVNRALAHLAAQGAIRLEKKRIVLVDETRMETKTPLAPEEG